MINYKIAIMRKQKP